MVAPDLLEGLFVAAANLNAKCEAAWSMLGRDCLVAAVPLFLVGQKRHGCSSDTTLPVRHYSHFQLISLSGTAIKICYTFM